MIQDPTVNQY